MAFLLVGEGPGNRPLDLSGGICPTASGMIVSKARFLPLDALLTSRSASLGAATYEGRGPDSMLVAMVGSLPRPTCQQ